MMHPTSISMMGHNHMSKRQVNKGNAAIVPILLSMMSKNLAQPHFIIYLNTFRIVSFYLDLIYLYSDYIIHKDHYLICYQVDIIFILSFMLLFK